MAPVADQDYASREERKRSPSYAEIYEPYDLPFNCQVVLMRDEDAFVRASVTRSHKQGPLDEEAFRAFRALMPHNALVLDVQPLPRERVCFGGSPAVLVVVRAAKLAECAGALRRAHGLTRAEADVALALADGQGLDAIAAQRSVAIATVRSQVQSVYAKMSVHRQAELAAAVRRLSGR